MQKVKHMQEVQESGGITTASNEFKESLKAWTAGTTAGIFSKVIEYPFDTVKGTHHHHYCIIS
jgi:hypothetical protein